MSGIYFEGILENSKIQSIGSLFRRVTGSRWEINLALSPKQDKTRLTMSNAPVLVRRRVLNPTEDVSPAGYLITLTIQSTDDWQAKLLAEYPIQDAVRWMDRDEWCFYFLADDGVQIFLPQFELARVLFFQNGYLSRTALELVQYLRSNSTKKARLTNCKLVLSKRSVFFQSRRHFSNQANERSTTQRWGMTAKV